MIEIANGTSSTRSRKMSQFEVELYIWTLTDNNKFDWRFPTYKEWEEHIANSDHSNAAWYEGLTQQRVRPTDWYYIVPVRDTDD